MGLARLDSKVIFVEELALGLAQLDLLVCQAELDGCPSGSIGGFIVVNSTKKTLRLAPSTALTPISRSRFGIHSFRFPSGKTSMMPVVFLRAARPDPKAGSTGWREGTGDAQAREALVGVARASSSSARRLISENLGTAVMPGSMSPVSSRSTFKDPKLKPSRCAKGQSPEQDLPDNFC